MTIQISLYLLLVTIGNRNVFFAENNASPVNHLYFAFCTMNERCTRTKCFDGSFSSIAFMLISDKMALGSFSICIFM